MPTASVGVITYAIDGHVAWLPALIGRLRGGRRPDRHVAAPKLSQTALRWAFVAFLIVVMVSLFFVIPSRDAELELTWITGPGLALLGVITGTWRVCSAWAGGIIVVPRPAAAVRHERHHRQGHLAAHDDPHGDLGDRRKPAPLERRHRAARASGFAACLTTPVGALIAKFVDPFVGNVLFAIFLVFIASQMAVKAVRGRHQR